MRATQPCVRLIAWFGCVYIIWVKGVSIVGRRHRRRRRGCLGIRLSVYLDVPKPLHPAKPTHDEPHSTNRPTRTTNQNTHPHTHKRTYLVVLEVGRALALHALADLRHGVHVLLVRLLCWSGVVWVSLRLGWWRWLWGRGGGVCVYVYVMRRAAQ